MRDGGQRPGPSLGMDHSVWGQSTWHRARAVGGTTDFGSAGGLAARLSATTAA